MECSSTTIPKVLFPYAIVQHAIEIAHHEGVQAGASSYHNILGRTRSYGTRSVGTMECSKCQYTWVLFPYVIEIVQHERVHAGTISYHNILGRTPPYNTIGCRHDGVQQYKYTKSIVPVRDRTA